MSLGDIEYRLKHVEDALPDLARIKEQNACFDKIEDLSSTVEELIKTVSDIDEAISVNSCSQVVFKDEILDVKSNHEEKIEEMQTDILTLRSEMKVLKSFDEKNVPEIISQLQQFQENFLNINNAVFYFSEELKKKLSIFEIQEFKDDMIEAQKAMMSSEVQNINRNMDLMFSTLKELSEKTENIYVQFDILRSKIKDINTFIDGLSADVMNEIKNHKATIEKSISLAVQAIKIPEQPNIADIKEGIRKEVEHLSLDAKNSYMKSSQNENRIAILEKKIDQIYLMINSQK